MMHCIAIIMVGMSKRWSGNTYQITSCVRHDKAERPFKRKPKKDPRRFASSRRMIIKKEVIRPAHTTGTAIGSLRLHLECGHTLEKWASKLFNAESAYCRFCRDAIRRKGK